VQKTTNPDGYAANLTAWQSALARASSSGKLPQETRFILHTSDELLNALACPAYGLPSGLGAVLDDCVRNGKMIDLREFRIAEKSIYSRSWVPSPWSILQWSMRQIGLGGAPSYDDFGRLRPGDLVLVQTLEAVSKHVLAAQAKRGQGLTDRIVSRNMFVQDLGVWGGETLSHQDLEVLLRYLERDKQALSFDSKTIKFKALDSTLPEPINSQDTTIANLKLLMTNLTAQISTLETRITSLQAKALAAVKSGNKHTALSLLRSKKLAEKNLQQRTDTFHQLDEVFTSIEQAADQVEVMKAMEASARVLKSLNQQVGGVERVEDVVDRLQKEIGKVDEVGQVISEPLDPKAILDEEDVDEELAAMEAEQRNAEEWVEAEKTRKRLKELDRLEREKRDTEGVAELKEQDLEGESSEVPLEASTKRLSDMSIEDDQGKSNQAAPRENSAAQHA
jgi:charged multivesicular body protein 7